MPRLGIVALSALVAATSAQPNVNACAGKDEGSSCSYVYGGGPKAGETFTGTCQSGACAAGCDGERATCPTTGTSDFTGLDKCKVAGIKAAPLRGSVGCIDMAPLATRPTATAGGSTVDANNIYGPMENGFSSAQPGASCLGSNVLKGGIDTNVAEAVMDAFCGGTFGTVLGYCGGHATPFHYHERMTCLYSATASGHSSRIGTASDGNGESRHVTKTTRRR